MLCTDKDNQQHQNSFHIQTEISHIGIVPLSVQDQSVTTESTFNKSEFKYNKIQTSRRKTP
jgi:hypothetical protein